MFGLSAELYEAEAWTMTQDRGLETFGLIKLPMTKFSGELMKTNTEFCLAKETSMDWPCLRHDGLLHEITEGRMRGKPTTGRIQMLHDLANDGGFVALKRAVEDREGWKHKVRMSTTTDDDVYSVDGHETSCRC